jgi:hypothetical protein
LKICAFRNLTDVACFIHAVLYYYFDYYSFS